VPDHFIYTSDDVLRMLDALLAGGGGVQWNEFFADRAKPCPFFVEWPDENLVAWFSEGLLTPGRVLELGCGHGRNATYLASLGCGVDAVDFSPSAIEWARERATSAGVPVKFQCCSIFDAAFTEGSYDLVYDSGCSGLRAGAPFSLRVLRQMKKTGDQGPCFGVDFLWVLLATKECSA
jgi:SAM-dependent methyltransferase